MYLQANSFWPSGQISAGMLGNVVNTGLQLNNRLQTSGMSANAAALPSVSGRGNLYDKTITYGSPNNGNIASIVDNLNPAWSQAFGYDGLNRLNSAIRTDGAFKHRYLYDSFGNMVLSDSNHATANFHPDEATNRMLLNNTDLQYDAAGQLTADPFHTYQYIPGGMLGGIDHHTTAVYVYDAQGQRSTKVTAAGTVDYVYWGNQPIAEHNLDGTWTDFLFANGQRIASVHPGGNIAHLSGSNVPGSGSVASGIQLGSLNNLTIQPGDSIRLWQYTTAENGSAGGIFLGFNNRDFSTSYARGPWFDSDGQPANMDGVTGRWHQRTLDMTQFQGETVNNVILLDERNGAVNQFDLFFADVAVHRADGTVIPVWIGATPASSLTATVFGPGQAAAQVDGNPPAGVNSAGVTTHLFLTDHLGSSSMELSSLGWPLWKGDYTPFGQEIINGTTNNSPGYHEDGASSPFKFTGKERDVESGLDYFGARYYSSVIGRFSSPDVVNLTDERLPSPSNMLNLYSYAANNPMLFNDPDGKDVTYFYDQSGTAGHAVLFAYNQQTGASAIESFGPIVHSPWAAGQSMFDMGIPQSADALRSEYAALTIQTSPELAQQIIAYIQSNPDPDNWFALGPNCSTQCSKILQQFKLEMQSRLRNPGLRPKLLWKDLTRQYNPNAPVNPKNGTDYGKPRTDMFNAMWRSLPQAPPDDSSVTTSQKDQIPCGGNGQPNC